MVSYLPDLLECAREGREYLERNVLHGKRFDDELWVNERVS